MTEYYTTLHYRLKANRWEMLTKQFFGSDHMGEAVTFMRSILPSSDYHVFIPSVREVK